MPQAHWAGERVGLGAELVAAPTEHLGARAELDVTLEPDHRLPLAHRAGQPIGPFRREGAVGARPYPVRMSSPAPAVRDPSTRSPTWLIWVALGIVYVIWGTTYLGIRVTNETLPPLIAP